MIITLAGKYVHHNMIRKPLVITKLLGDNRFCKYVLVSSLQKHLLETIKNSSHQRLLSSFQFQTYRNCVQLNDCIKL